jgi:hypothetical protein
MLSRSSRFRSLENTRLSVLTGRMAWRRRNVTLVGTYSFRTLAGTQALSTGIYCNVAQSMRPPLWSSGQSSWLQIRRPGFDSRHYKKKK